MAGAARYNGGSFGPCWVWTPIGRAWKVAEPERQCAVSCIATRRSPADIERGRSLPAADGCATIPLSADQQTARPRNGETHEQGRSLRLWLGRRRRGRADDLRRLRHDAVARRVPAADLGCDGLVARRYLGGGDAGFPLHGLCGVCLGRAVRPLRHPHRGAGRQPAARARPGDGEPGAEPVAIPALLRRADRHRRRQLLCADDGAGERLDRQASQPRRRAGVGRHGRVAADGRAIGELADHGL